MDGAQIRVFEQSNEVSLASFPKGTDGCGLKPQVSFKVLGNLTNQSLEWQFPDQQLSGLLVAADLPQSNCPWPVSVGLLHAPSTGCTFPCGLSGQLFARSLPSSRLPSGLLSTSHL